MTSWPTPVRAALTVVLLASGVALLLVGQPSPVLLGLAALWLAGVLGWSLRAPRRPGREQAARPGTDGSADVSSDR